MLEIKSEIKVVPTEEAKAKAEEDLKTIQPAEEEATKIVAKYCEKKGTDEKD